MPGSPITSANPTEVVTKIPDVYIIGCAAALGLLFGSFATVVAYRVPRNEDIVHGRSKCPTCGRTITALENIPVFSYLWQRGRCRNCKTKISIRYPLTELASGVLFAGAAWKFGFTVEAFVFAALFWSLVVLTAIDLEHKLLPDRIVYPSFIVGWAGLSFAAAVNGDFGRLGDAALGALIFGGFFFAVIFIYPPGMGFGDVKLAFVLGTFLGYLDAPGHVLLGMFLSFVLGSVVGVGAMVMGGSRKTQIPFGPFLAAGTVLTIFFGQGLLDAYQRMGA